MTIPEKKWSGIKAIAFDFDGVFTDNLVYVMQNGDEAVACNRSDGMGISMLRAKGVPLVIISTEGNPIVKVRAAKLNLEVIQGVDDKLPRLIDCRGACIDGFKRHFAYPGSGSVTLGTEHYGAAQD